MLFWITVVSVAVAEQILIVPGVKLGDAVTEVVISKVPPRTEIAEVRSTGRKMNRTEPKGGINMWASNRTMSASHRGHREDFHGGQPAVTSAREPDRAGSADFEVGWIAGRHARWQRGLALPADLKTGDASGWQTRALIRDSAAERIAVSVAHPWLFAGSGFAPEPPIVTGS